MAAELVKNLAGIDIVHVPYKGSTGARNDIISGQIDMMFDSVPTMAPMIEAGRVKALGTSGRVRSPVLPNVPTLAEAGLPDYRRDDLDRRDGAGGHAATNRRSAQHRDQQDPLPSGHRGGLAAQGANTLIMKPDEFGAYVQSEIERWAKLIKANGIKTD